jgi:hypothetical protein
MNSGEYFALVIFICFASIPVTLAILSRIKPKQFDNGLPHEPQKPKLQKNFYVGDYLGNIPGSSKPVNISYCTVDENFLKFTGGIRGIEFQRIPIDSVNTISVEDKALVAQRVPEIEKSALDKIVSPETKQRKYYCLFIDWKDKRGVKYYTFFQFGGSGKEGLANSAANTLKRWVHPEDVTAEKSQLQTI